MRLHENKQLFADAINAASRPKNDGGLGIKSIFIEKDYWICRSLKLMAEGDKDGKAVFKGGTSLSKAYGIGARFSEDIDVAIAEAWTLSGNQLKNLIRRTAKNMTAGLANESASPLAKDVPTSRLPKSPGPRVKAMAERSCLSTPARLSAVSTTGSMFCWWARLANSGTTPPYSSCTFCPAMTLLSRIPSRITAAEVSSQLDSMAKMVITIRYFRSLCCFRSLR